MCIGVSASLSLSVLLCCVYLGQFCMYSDGREQTTEGNCAHISTHWPDLSGEWVGNQAKALG